jgi:glycosyltransferase involved in cell wall biosynthesis
MRICFVSHFNSNKGTGDIGTKNVAINLADTVSKHHEVIKIDIKDLGSWKKARDFKPDIIHFVLAPTTFGFITAKIFSSFFKESKVVMSAPNPTLSFRGLVSHFKPDLILTQSVESENMFKDWGFQTAFLPNGVDIDRFVPVNSKLKDNLRVKYGIEKNKFIILHIGPIIHKRGIDLLMDLQNRDRQVIVVGRKGYDKTLLNKLKKRNIRVMLDYLENIEDFYSLSDCYVFPTNPAERGASIEIPLSVLEAMSCNLPVITSKFGGLTRAFREGDGLFFVNNDNETFRVVDIIRNDKVKVNTRHKVSPYSWNGVVEKLNDIYEESLY